MRKCVIQMIGVYLLLQALDHFSSSGSKLLVTTNLKSKQKRDIHYAQYKDLNLMFPPVNLVPPVCQIPDKSRTG